MHALRFVLQLPDGRILGGFCSGICFGLAGERSFLPAERTGAGLGHLIVNRPCGRTIAAVEVKTVILRMTARSNGLRCGRTHLPTAAVHAAAGPAGRDGNNRAVHLSSVFSWYLSVLTVNVRSKLPPAVWAGAVHAAE